MKNRKYWVWLSLALGVATSAHQRLLPAFDNNIENIYNSSEDELKGLRLSPRQKSALLDKSTDEAERIIGWCDNNNVKILCYDDERYPDRLRQIPDSPTVLYYIGTLYKLDDMLCMACVGTRDMTRYGHDAAYAFCHDLAKCGAVVVSGLAAGIDTACHRAALDAGGKTVAVLGCRINKVYPMENRPLMVEIARNGLLLTEYHPFYKTSPMNFPKRNRIISGLSQATVVFEADNGSGSLITANTAKKQGRAIYALPGNIGNSGSVGTNQLISDGAKIVTRVSDIIDEYRYLYPDLGACDFIYDYSPAHKAKDSFIKTRKTARTAEDKSEKAPESVTEADPSEIPSDLTGVERVIFERLDISDARSQDYLYIPEYTPNEIMSALTMLELKGYIEVSAGNKYRRLK